MAAREKLCFCWTRLFAFWVTGLYSVAFFCLCTFLQGDVVCFGRQVVWRWTGSGSMEALAEGGWLALA
jgi:hypothetical protein